MDNPMDIAADIRFGVHHRLASLTAHIDKCVTDYAQGALLPQDEDYAYVISELKNVSEQLHSFMGVKASIAKGGPFTNNKGG